MDERMNECTNRQMDGWIMGQMDRQIGGWMDGMMDE